MESRDSCIKTHYIHIVKRQRILKAVRERQHIIYRGNSMRQPENFSAAILQTRTKWDDIFRVVGEGDNNNNKGRQLQYSCRNVSSYKNRNEDSTPSKLESTAQTPTFRTEDMGVRHAMFLASLWGPEFSFPLQLLWAFRLWECVSG